MFELVQETIDRARTIILDKGEKISLALACLLAGGHLLLEDIPGVGKTLLGKTLARLLGLGFQRIQCTNDLLPSDILGSMVFDRQKGNFQFHPGPIFAQLVLIDEINRAAPKTQSGLLEAMAEGQVTIDRQTHPLPSPFFVFATQNPRDQAGTYPLPESQLDRFMLSLELGYPSPQAEITILDNNLESLLQSTESILRPEQVLSLQQMSDKTHASLSILQYIQVLLHHTRIRPEFQYGLSPRAGKAILRCAKAWALIAKRDFVLPEDVQAVFPHVARHRLTLAQPGSFQVQNAHIQEILKSVPIP